MFYIIYHPDNIRYQCYKCKLQNMYNPSYHIYFIKDFSNPPVKIIRMKGNGHKTNKLGQEFDNETKYPRLIASINLLQRQNAAVMNLVDRHSNFH